MHLVRDWMALNSPDSTRPVRETGEADPILDAMHDALQDAAMTARWDFPELFLKADKLRAKPGRETQPMQPYVYAGVLKRCEGCGALFPPFPSWARYCTNYCSAAHRHAHKEGV